MTSLLPRERAEVASGAVHVPDWLDADGQRELVAACRTWAQSPAPMRAARTPGGGRMSVQTVCLGWHCGGRTNTPPEDVPQPHGGWEVPPRPGGTPNQLPRTSTARRSPRFRPGSETSVAEP